MTYTMVGAEFRNAGNFLFSPTQTSVLRKIHRLHFDPIGLVVGDIELPWPTAKRLARVRAPTSRRLIAAPLRHGNSNITFPNTCQFGRQIGEPVRDEMHNISFPLHPAIDGNPCPMGR